MGSSSSVPKGPVPIQGPIVPGSMAKHHQSKKNKRRKNGKTYVDDIINSKKGVHSGNPEDCNAKQREILDKVREFVKNVPKTGADKCEIDDHSLMRFLIGFNWHLPKIQQVLQNYIEYRSSHAVELHTYDDTIEKQVKYHFQRSVYGVDRQGRPVMIERVGSANFKKLFEICPKEEFIRIYCHLAERLEKEIFPKCSEAVGKPIREVIFILDGSGIQQISNDLKDFFMTTFPKINEWFPETAIFLICNLPSKFVFFANLILMFVGGTSKKKMKIVKDNTRLQELIDIDQLPDFLGGTNTTEDYGDLFDAEKGPWVKTPVKN